MKEMGRDEYCLKMAAHISEVMSIKVNAVKVSEQLMLIELGKIPTDKIISKFIKG